MNLFFQPLAIGASLTWDPDRNFFIIPYIDHPITWYGLIFAFSFLVSYFLMRHIFTIFLHTADRTEAESRLVAVTLLDRLSLLVILGTVIGARLGHVFFYGWPYYQSHPLAIFKIWEGGLASHGGAIGIFLALMIFIRWSKKIDTRMTFLAVLDAIVIPTAFVAGCIRIGNFINQEITGIPTTLPWGIEFLHPLEGIPGIAVHPVQLYESFFYFCTFIFLIILWKRHKERLGTALFSGWFFLLVFGFRFLIEFLKMPQSEVISENYLNMGQWLSLPFIALGLFLIIFSKKKRKLDDMHARNS